jgi:hypothetical protein
MSPDDEEAFVLLITLLLALNISHREFFRGMEMIVVVSSF